MFADLRSSLRSPPWIAKQITDAAPSLGSPCIPDACRFRGFPPSARAARRRKLHRGRAIADHCHSSRTQAPLVSSIGRRCTAASGPAGGGAQWPAPGRRLGRIHVPVRYGSLTTLRRSRSGVPEADISGSRLARRCARGPRAAARISDYASSHRGQGGSSVGDTVRATGIGLGGLPPGCPSWATPARTTIDECLVRYVLTGQRCGHQNGG